MKISIRQIVFIAVVCLLCFSDLAFCKKKKNSKGKKSSSEPKQVAHGKSDQFLPAKFEVHKLSTYWVKKMVIVENDTMIATIG